MYYLITQWVLNGKSLNFVKSKEKNFMLIHNCIRAIQLSIVQSNKLKVHNTHRLPVLFLPAGEEGLQTGAVVSRDLAPNWLAEMKSLIYKVKSSWVTHRPLSSQISLQLWFFSRLSGEHFLVLVFYIISRYRQNLWQLIPIRAWWA